MAKVTIEEQGNGFPVVGAYVQADGEVYRVVAMGSRIETQGPGRGNRVPGCEVEEADWSDLGVDEEPHVCGVVLSGEEPADHVIEHLATGRGMWVELRESTARTGFRMSAIRYTEAAAQAEVDRMVEAGWDRDRLRVARAADEDAS